MKLKHFEDEEELIEIEKEIKKEKKKKKSIKGKIPKTKTRILLNFFDYEENQKEILEQIAFEFGFNVWIILELDTYFGRENREISDENIKRVKANNILI